MEKKDTHLENFKQALISTIKSISEKNDCEVSFGKQASKNYNNVNLPEIKKLEHFQDFLTMRAKADSEALRLKYSDEDIFNTYKPKGKIAEELYEIAEKIRYEKIGSDKLFYQTLEDLIESTLMDTGLEMQFDSSCFDGKYIAGNITDSYLKELYDKRNDNAKQEDSDEDQVLDLHNDSA